MAPETALIICRKCRGRNPGCMECGGSGFVHAPVKKEHKTPQFAAKTATSGKAGIIISGIIKAT